MANYIWARRLNFRRNTEVHHQSVTFDFDNLSYDPSRTATYNRSLSITDKTYTKRLLQSAGGNSGFLPPAVRSFSPDGRLAVFETPPSYKTISVSNHSKSGVSADNLKQVTIPLPWIVYSLAMNSEGQCTRMAMAYAKKPLAEKDNVFYYPLLPNVFEDLTICMPGRFYERKHKNYADLINDMLASYWSSSFNQDISINYSALEHVNYYSKKTFDNRNIWTLMGSLTLEDVLNLDFLEYKERFINVNASTNPLLMSMYG